MERLSVFPHEPSIHTTPARLRARPCALNHTGGWGPPASFSRSRLFSRCGRQHARNVWDGSNPVESTWKRFGSSRCAPALSGYGRHSQILRGGEVHLPPSLSASCILFFYEWPSPPGAATKDFVTFCHAGTLARGHAWYRVISESLSPSRFDRWQSRTVRRIVPSAHQHLCKPTLGLIRSISFRLVREKNATLSSECARASADCRCKGRTGTPSPCAGTVRLNPASGGFAWLRPTPLPRTCVWRMAPERGRE